MDDVYVFVLDYVRIAKRILWLVRERRLTGDVECRPLLLVVIQLN